VFIRGKLSLTGIIMRKGEQREMGKKEKEEA
jgi:hypothetical protein